MQYMHAILYVSLFQTKAVETGHLQQEITDLRKEQRQVKKDEQVKELLVCMVV